MMTAYHMIDARQLHLNKSDSTKLIEKKNPVSYLRYLSRYWRRAQCKPQLCL